ncbi:hypothetical protein B7463_g2048, partial [Scytalidium lignicola]
MTRIATLVLREYLLWGRIPTTGCLRRPAGGSGATRRIYTPRYQLQRALHTTSEPGSTAAPATATDTPDIVPFRKQLKDEAKQRKAEGLPKKAKSNNQELDNWELTVGIEIHAQLNTARKLFSSAASTINDVPNTHVSFFDLALPGSQPQFQKATLVPAIRAALALNCNVQHQSKFDRKHYFHWDQPSGYQITQYYEPFAKDGYITLYAHDGIAKEDGEVVRIGIKQVQMEQDTAKTISQPGDVHLLDFNRVGIPLIEIITLPQIHYPATAAALVRKIQTLLEAVDACVLGMESGGLRADVNVSVKRKDGGGATTDVQSYAGISGLGQRTEIKNLSSFKAVEDAIIAERDRQIALLEAGGVVEGETRGWTIGSTETRRLRGKEGEVDYRYMPDPDLGPVVIGEDLIKHLEDKLGVLPDEELNILVEEYGLTVKDAMSLMALNDGGRVEYFWNVVDELLQLKLEDKQTRLGKLACNWVLHEMGGLTSDSEEDYSNPLQITASGECIIPSHELATLIHHLDSKRITGQTAKRLLASLFEAARGPNAVKGGVEQLIEENGLWLRPMSEQEYDELARSVIENNMKQVEDILKGKMGKIMFLVGQMMREGEEGRVEPQEAEKVLRRLVEEYRK